METSLKVVMAEKEALLAEQGGKLYTVTPDATAASAIAAMCDAGIGCVLVVQDDRLLGVFSERDVMRRIALRGLAADQVTVGEVMTTQLVTVTPDTTVEQALIQCTDRRIRHLPVTVGEQLLGLLSIGDLVRFVVKDKDRTIADLTDYIHGHQIQI